MGGDARRGEEIGGDIFKAFRKEEEKETKDEKGFQGCVRKNLLLLPWHQGQVAAPPLLLCWRRLLKGLLEEEEEEDRVFLTSAKCGGVVA